MSQNKCPYCKIPLCGKYCHQCGLLVPVVPLRFKGLWRDFYDRIIQFEMSFFRTCFFLLLQPQRVVQSFLVGERRFYTHPFTLLLLVATVNVLLAAWLQPGFIDQFKQMMANMAPATLTMPQQTRYIDFYLQLFKLLPYWMLLFTLAPALILRLLSPKPKLYTAELWCLCLYGVSQALILDVFWGVFCLWQQFDITTQNSGTNVLLLLCQIICLVCGCGWRGWWLPKILLAILSSYIIMGFGQYYTALLYARW